MSTVDQPGPGEAPALAQETARMRRELTLASGGTDPFAAAVRHTRMPMAISDPRQADNPVVFVNDAFLRLTGYGRDEVVGRNCRFLQGSGTNPRSVDRLRAAVAAAESIEIDIRNYRKDGTAFWNRVLVVPVHDTAGAVIYFFASQFDVTLERERLVDLEARNDQLAAELAGRMHALQESEDRFLQMADHAPVMIWLTDTEGQRSWTGQSWVEFTGQDATAAADEGWLQVVHPADRTAIRQSLSAAIATLQPCRLEYRLRRADGSYAWVMDSAAPRLDGLGTSVGYVGSVLDITDRRETEARLELSEQSLRLATEAGEIGTWDVDVVSGRLHWSDRTQAMFGVFNQPTRPLADFYAQVHHHDLEATQQAFRRATDPALRAPYDVEYRAVGHDDGVVRWIAAKGKGMFDDSGRCTRAIGTAIDISSRKAAETRQATLMALADRLREAVDARAIAAAATDLLAIHFGASRVGYALIRFEGAGLQVVEDLTEGLASSGQAFPIGALGPTCREHLREGRVSVHEDVLIDPTTNHEAWQAAAIRAVIIVPLIRDGRLSASFYVGHHRPRRWAAEDVQLIEQVAARVWDAAERARAEDALRRLNATLEARVEERTAELERAEEALRQSQKMEAVGQLTGGIAHDFNNLLTGVVGALEMLQRRVAQGRFDELQRYASIASESAHRAASLTQRLLAFARRQPLDPREVEINGLMGRIEDLLRRTLGPSIELEIITAPELWPTMCDPGQLENSILHLVANARDAMPQGGRLTIRTANAKLDTAYARAAGGEVKPGHYVSVQVADSGLGMSDQVLARIFEPFFTTKPIGQGAGLGLSQLYGFVKQSGGHVLATSERGRGATFRLYLPRHVGSNSGVAAERSSDVAATDDGYGTVLVVEDEMPVRMLITENLAELGFRVLEAVDGPSGLEILLSRTRVDLLITDVGLPGLNGRQLADAAREVRPNLKVLFITGFAGNAAVGDRVLESGMQILTKPFAMAMLTDKVRGLVDKP